MLRPWTAAVVPAATTMPRLSATVGEEIAALKRVAATGGGRIKRERIRSSWVCRRLAANFRRQAGAQARLHHCEKTFDDIIKIHIEDELGGNFVPKAMIRKSGYRFSLATNAKRLREIMLKQKDRAG